MSGLTTANSFSGYSLACKLQCRFVRACACRMQFGHSHEIAVWTELHRVIYTYGLP